MAIKGMNCMSRTGWSQRVRIQACDQTFSDVREYDMGAEVGFIVSTRSNSDSMLRWMLGIQRFETIRTDEIKAGQLEKRD